MVQNPKKKEFDLVLAAIKARDGELAAEITADVRPLIPKDPDILTLRGASWRSKVAGRGVVYVVPPLPGAPPVAVGILVLSQGRVPVPGVGVEVIRTPDNAQMAVGTTQEDGFIRVELLAGGYLARARAVDSSGSTAFTIGTTPAEVTVTLVPLAAPPPGGEPPGGPPQPPRVTSPGAFAVGDRVLVYGSMAGAVASVPDVPGDSYDVLLDIGVRVRASAGDLGIRVRRVDGFAPA